MIKQLVNAQEHDYWDFLWMVLYYWFEIEFTTIESLIKHIKGEKTT